MNGAADQFSAGLKKIFFFLNFLKEYPLQKVFYVCLARFL